MSSSSVDGASAPLGAAGAGLLSAAGIQAFATSGRHAVVGLATRRALARGSLSQDRLERAVADLRQCIDRLSDEQQRVLMLRAGLGPRPALSRTQVAHRLDLGRAQTGRIERRGLRRLGALDAAGRCGAGGGAAASAASSLLGPTNALAVSAIADDDSGQARFGIEGVSTSGGGGGGGASLDDVLPPPLGDGGDWTVLILLMLAATVGLLVRRELKRR